MEKKELEQRINELGSLLVSQLKPEGYWEGRLSSSALAVAVSVTALYFDDEEEHAALIEKGMDWLRLNINQDGSFGDTPGSPGNVSTSLLVYAAANLFSEKLTWINPFIRQIAEYLAGRQIDVNSPQVSEAILRHYEKDYTFSVPILTMCGLCGIPGKDAFDYIPQLPFELSLFPRSIYRSLNLSVVSYAIPALVAVGIVIFKKKRTGKIWHRIRRVSVPVAMKILHRLLPGSGGFLEAIPLTAFVSLSLLNSGFRDSEVVRRGIGFLKATQREDGSWPIDVDLSTWVTSLAVKSFRTSLNNFVPAAMQTRIAGHFKRIQNREVHAFNGTGPGGWGWTSFSGSVPDGDDTPGVILALMKLQPEDARIGEVLEGCSWLLKLQNNDGGFPTFSKGWGKLPFDQSCSDLTGHNILAISSVIENCSAELSAGKRKQLIKAVGRAVQYLSRHQRFDGSWLPLWFGNQQVHDRTNPVYGTARVITYLKDASAHTWMPEKLKEQLQTLIERGTSFLATVQNGDGSWGGGKNISGTIEETALAVSALASTVNPDACIGGLKWLDNFYKRNGMMPAPIGLYFASLWYDEELYPITAYMEALTRVYEIMPD
jgi:prenyltransferase beta subunit